MGRVLLALLVGAAAAVGVLASQSGVTAVAFSAGSGASTPCDGDGVRTAFTTGFDASRGYTITQVVVSGIDFPGCRGQDVQVILTDSAHRQLGQGGAPVSGSSVTVPVVPAVTASALDRVHAVIAN